MTTLTDQNDINKALIDIGAIQFNGLNQQGLIYAVIKAMRDSKTSKLAIACLDGEENVDQINFAKIVWNAASVEVRSCFLTTNNDWFLTLAGDPEMTNILIAAVEKHEGGTTGGGNPEKYMEIVKRIEGLKIKQAGSDNPFNPQLTEKERNAIKKFDDKAKENEEHGARETHHPNESAVTYCYLLGRLIYYSELKIMKKQIGTVVNIVDDMLRFYSAHGQKTVFLFNEVFNKFTNIIGPKSKLDIKPFISSLIENENYVTATGKDENNKFLPNHKLSLKRIIRLVYICTNYKTVWGIMNSKEEFSASIKKLFMLETSIEAADMNSLAIIWYLCIGRENINTVIVDHWEKSASNQLAVILGNDEQNGFAAPRHAFPLNKNTNEKFNLSE